MMTREQMIDEVIRCFGFESKWTIWFCELAENETVTNKQLEMAMETLNCVDVVESEEE